MSLKGSVILVDLGLCLFKSVVFDHKSSGQLYLSFRLRNLEKHRSIAYIKFAMGGGGGGGGTRCARQLGPGESTVEPLNNVTFGTSYSVQVSEVINVLAL